MIKITVEDREGAVRLLEITAATEQNLMETLKTFEYDMRATCGGMALCADCHCKIVNGGDNLPEPEEAELITLDTRPDANASSRLACQLKVNSQIDGLHIKLMGYQ
ncbi:2Fe-2S iron-sulfur cluster-binding protein [Desertivirga brevis]|uniref:2Fe-2S iron-sulfur cluster-binding protein n=1 Tax=Desertivirga brevis TaxID=2810310 RepID=UPI001A978293|nr:2Fe-2S iron-sulfur cluster-binding protein [Pedobacter sp. SYSU D00873]